VIILAKGAEPMQKKEAMKMAIRKAQETMKRNYGGPFGAAILDPNGQIIAVASNTVLKDHDATAHAEINAIRQASLALGTHDLSGCILVATAYPCPMCLGAIIWANIKSVVYGARKEDADHIGFRDDFMYQFIREGMQDREVLSLEESEREACLALFKEYQERSGTIY